MIKKALLYIAAVFLLFLSIGLLYGVILSQFLFPGYPISPWTHILCLFIEALVLALISIAEKRLEKHGLPHKTLFVTASIKCIFCVLFLLFCLFNGSWKGMALLWLLLTFFLYLLIPRIMNTVMDDRMR